MNMLLVLLLGVIIGSLLIPKIVENFGAYDKFGLLFKNNRDEYMNMRPIDYNRSLFNDNALIGYTLGNVVLNNLKKINKTPSIMTMGQLNDYMLTSSSLNIVNMDHTYSLVGGDKPNIYVNDRDLFVFLVKDGDTYKLLKLTEIPNIDKIINPTTLNRLRGLPVYRDTSLSVQRVGSLNNLRINGMNMTRADIMRTYKVNYIPFVVLSLI